MLTGAALGRSLAFAWNVPAVAVHHLEGHLLAPLLEDDPPPFPHLALLVSGGHTMLIDVAAPGRYAVLGETRDDAAGEAFDKSAKLLGLPYPGGPELAKLAAQRHARIASIFPRPMVDRAGLEFSFSGLKTAVVAGREGSSARWRRSIDATRADIAASVQEAIVDTLIAKTLRALEQTGYDALVVAGGVGANRLLRERLAQAAARHGARVYYPRIEFCTDNAAMIAVAGMARLKAGKLETPAIRARATWSLTELGPLCGIEVTMSKVTSGPKTHTLPSSAATPDTGDRIFLHGLAVECIIGFIEWERRVKQTVVLDVEMPVDCARAARVDDVADTLDYKKVAKRLIAFVEGSEFKLVETLAHRTALLILEEFGVDWVRLSINKPGAIRHSKDVGVAVLRTRADLAK